MTDTSTSPTGKDRPENDSGVGVRRPDQVATEQPGQTPEGPASGGEGSAGAGGSDGFGSGQ